MLRAPCGVAALRPAGILTVIVTVIKSSPVLSLVSIFDLRPSNVRNVYYIIFIELITERRLVLWQMFS